MLYIVGVLINKAKLKEIRVESQEIEGLTYFEEKGDCVLNYNVLTIYDVIRLDRAIAYISLDDQHSRSGLEVLIIADDEETFYDGKVIEIPKDKCFHQVGVYEHYSKTLPAVIIDDK